MAAPRRPHNADLREREYLTPKEVDRLQDAARKHSRYGHRDATAILIAYRHGLRASELCELTWNMIELDGGRIHVRRAKNGVKEHPCCVDHAGSACCRAYVVEATAENASAISACVAFTFRQDSLVSHKAHHKDVLGVFGSHSRMGAGMGVPPLAEERTSQWTSVAAMASISTRKSG